jgi:hypothetical protein
MVLSFTLTKRDHWRAVREVNSRTLNYKFAWAFFGGVPIATALVALFLLPNGTQFVMNELGLLILGPLMMVAGFPLIHYLTVRSYHRTNALVQQPQVFELTPSQLVMRGPLYNSQLSWPGVREVVETKRTILFYVAKNVAHFLPKSALGPGQLDELRADLAQWLPGRVRLRGRALVAPAA